MTTDTLAPCLARPSVSKPLDGRKNGPLAQRKDLTTKVYYKYNLNCVTIIDKYQEPTQIAKFLGPTWGPPGSCRPQMDSMLAPWTLITIFKVYQCQLKNIITNAINPKSYSPMRYWSTKSIKLQQNTTTVNTVHDFMMYHICVSRPTIGEACIFDFHSHYTLAMFIIGEMAINPLSSEQLSAV